MPSLSEELSALQGRPEPDGGPAEAAPAAIAVPAAAAPGAAAAVAAPAPIAPAAVASVTGAAPVAVGAAPALPGLPAGAPAPIDPQAPRASFASVEEATSAFVDQQKRAATERVARRQLERAHAEEQQRNALMTQNFNALMTRVLTQQQGGAPQVPPQQPQAQPFAPPTAEEINTDPMKAIQRLAAFAQAAIQERQDIERVTYERAQQAQENSRVVQLQTQQVQAVATGLRDFEAEYEIAQPDYPQAAKYYVDSRKQQLKTMYPGFDDDRLTAAITHEVLNSAAQALRNGANPAALLYQAATHMGYRYAPAPAPQPGVVLPGVAAPAPLAANPLEQVQAGLQAAASLSAGGGGAPSGDGVGLAEGLSLTGAAFSAWQEKFLEQHTGRKYG